MRHTGHFIDFSSSFSDMNNLFYQVLYYCVTKEQRYRLELETMLGQNLDSIIPSDCVVKSSIHRGYFVKGLTVEDVLARIYRVEISQCLAFDFKPTMFHPTNLCADIEMVLNPDKKIAGLFGISSP